MFLKFILKIFGFIRRFLKLANYKTSLVWKKADRQLGIYHFKNLNKSFRYEKKYMNKKSINLSFIIINHIQRRKKEAEQKNFKRTSRKHFRVN